MVQRTGSAADLTWLIDDMIVRTEEAEHGVVLSKDGLLMASSRGLGREDAEHLSAVASGIQSLARGVGERFGGGAVRQTVVEMRTAYLIVTVAGEGACLAVLCTENADIGLVAYEMAMLVTRVGQHLSSAARVPQPPGKGDAAL